MNFNIVNKIKIFINVKVEKNDFVRTHFVKHIGHIAKIQCHSTPTLQQLLQKSNFANSQLFRNFFFTVSNFAEPRSNPENFSLLA